VMIAGPPRCPVWCRLVTVPTDPFTTFTRPTGPFLSWVGEMATRKHSKCRNHTSIVNLVADSELGNPSSYCLRFIVTIGLSCLVAVQLNCFVHDWNYGITGSMEKAAFVYCFWWEWDRTMFCGNGRCCNNTTLSINFTCPDLQFQS